MKIIQVLILLLFSQLLFSDNDSPKLCLYYLPWCPYSHTVLSYLEKIHKTIPLKNLQKDPEGRQELLSLGGKTQVPCLIIDGQALYESEAILQWIFENQDNLDSE